MAAVAQAGRPVTEGESYISREHRLERYSTDA